MSTSNLNGVFGLVELVALQVDRLYDGNVSSQAKVPHGDSLDQLARRFGCQHLLELDVELAHYVPSNVARVLELLEEEIAEHVEGDDAIRARVQTLHIQHLLQRLNAENVRFNG